MTLLCAARCLAAGLGLAVVAPAHSAFAAAPDVISLSRGGLRLGVDRQGGGLVELSELRTKHDLVGAGPAALWELELLSEQKAATLTPEQAKSFHCEKVGRGRAQFLQLDWRDFGLATAPELRVEARVSLDADSPMSRWDIRVGGLGALRLDKVHFPRLVNLPRQDHERLAVPVWLGQETAKPRELISKSSSSATNKGPSSGKRLEWAYPGALSLQCLAFYQQDGPGLYVACDDAAAYRKSFAFFGDGRGNASCELVHLPENADRGAAAWVLPYQVLVGAFAGDWLTAAERYRAWGTNQLWAAQSRLTRGAVPDWVLKTGAWVWNRGCSPGVLTPAVEFERKLHLPVSVFWHWWHGCAYDTGFPEYLPPREGAEPFKGALSAAHAEGTRALVYMNQRLWGITTRSWTNEGAERFAVKGSDGKVAPEVYNTFTRQPCAAMCMGTEFWRNKYAGLAESAFRELGVDGIYMDQACSTLACYDAGHGHPRGGGTYWINGFRRLTEEIRRGCDAALRDSGRAPVVLAGEGCGEAWLPYLDLMLSLQVSKERYAAQDGWETIPFFQAVYHPYAVTYGNYSSLTMPPYDDLWPAEYATNHPLKLLDRKFSRQFLLEQARAFVWGQQPTIANFLPAQFEQRPEEIDYVMRLARIRSQATRYLLYGTFLRPPDLRAPAATLDMSRLSIYAGQQGGLTEFVKASPLALAGAWRAPNGDVAVALASLAEEPLELSFKIDGRGCRLPKGARVYRTDEAGRNEIGPLAGRGAETKVNLRPRGACVVEFARE
jgi:hypothetical protein